MELVFNRKNGEEIVYTCDGIKMGGDGRDLYLVIGNGDYLDQGYIGRLVTNSTGSFCWHIIDMESPNNLYFNEDFYSFFIRDSEKLIDKENINKKHSVSAFSPTNQFSLGWERGYDQGYEIGVIHSTRD